MSATICGQMTHFILHYLSKYKVYWNWKCSVLKLEKSKNKKMSLTEPKCNVLEMFQSSAGVELSANQFVFWKICKSHLHSLSIPYFLNEKISKLLQRLEQLVFHAYFLQDYGLWCFKTTAVIKYTSKTSDQWRDIINTCIIFIFMLLLLRVSR